jgi:N utilization substance protein B
VLLEEFFEEGHFLSLIDEDPLFKGMPDDRQMDYIRRLVTLCHEHRAEIDRHIETYSKGWKPKRISGTAAAVLRCALCEILYMDDIPDSAAINEAVELAKKYDEPQTVSFVNGVLGGFMRGRQPSGEVSDPVAASEPLAESGE